MIDYSHEPLLFTTKKPKDLNTQPWRDLNTPNARIIVGDKRSGKDVVADKEKKINWDNHITNIQLHDGGGHEGLYTIVNKNCKRKWEIIAQILQNFVDGETEVIPKDRIQSKAKPEEFESILDQMIMQGIIKIDKNDNISITELGYDVLDDKILHCVCDMPIPTLLMKPNFVKHFQEQVDRFNGLLWDSYEEYDEAFIHCKVDQYLTREQFEAMLKGKKKPKEMTEKIVPLLKIIEYPVPLNTRTHPNAVEEFREIARKAVVQARDEHRMFVAVDTAFFPENHQGKTWKYTTIAEWIRFLPVLAQTVFVIPKLNKLRSEWTGKEKSWHKNAPIIPEVRDVAPSKDLSGDPESQISKRALFHWMAKSRHTKSFPVMNSQSIMDVLEKMNKQNDITIVKRSSDKNLGKVGLMWFKERIIDDRFGQLTKWGFDIEEPWKIPYEAWEQLDRKLPMLAEIPDNKGYVIMPNGDYKLVTFEMQCWHHKSDRDEFTNDTGIQFVVEESLTLPDEAEVSQAVTKTSTKKLSDDDYRLILKMLDEEKSYKEIIEYMQKKDKQDGLLIDRFAASDPVKNLSNKVINWKKSQENKKLKQNILN